MEKRVNPLEIKKAPEENNEAVKPAIEEKPAEKESVDVWAKIKDFFVMIGSKIAGGFKFCINKIVALFNSIFKKEDNGEKKGK